jgi:uncharacterized protein
VPPAGRAAALDKARAFARQLGSKSGQAIVRGILGGLFKGR